MKRNYIIFIFIFFVVNLSFISSNHATNKQIKVNNMIKEFQLQNFSTLKTEKEKKLFLKKIISDLEKNVQPLLPADWTVQLSLYDKNPHSWQNWKNELKPWGIKMVLKNINPSFKEEVKKPYASLQVKNKKESDNLEEISPQMIRYFYFSLDAGFSYSAFERVHPDELVHMGEHFIIIRPAPVSAERDHKIDPLVITLMQNLWHYEEKENGFNYKQHDKRSSTIEIMQEETMNKKSLWIKLK